MDPVTHTLVGVGVANAAFRRRFGPAWVPVRVLASNLSDLDAVVHLTGDPAAVLMRRTFGHSLFLLPIWAVALAWLLGRRFREIHFRSLLGAVFLGAGLHLFFDLINSFGVVLLWPFSVARPELAWVFIIDFILTGLLALPLVLCLERRLRPRLETLSRASLVAVAMYLAFCGLNRHLAVRALERETAAAPAVAAGAAPDFTYVFPEPLGPHRWRGVARHGDRYDVYLIHSMTGKAERKAEGETSLHDPDVDAARRTRFGKRLDWFFKAPVWSVSTPDPGPGVPAVTAYDLRFRQLVLERPPVFQFTVPGPFVLDRRPRLP